jgi:hypothetical protein
MQAKISSTDVHLCGFDVAGAFMVQRGVSGPLWEQREILLGRIALPDTDTVSHS